MDTSGSHPTSPWIVRGNTFGSGKVGLICLPYAGGGAGAFYRWSLFLDTAIDLIRIQLPGHETRIREPLLKRLDEVVNVLADALFPFLDRPFMVYGHSMGGLLGFELIRKLRADHGIIPAHFFVSSFRAPHLPPEDPTIHDLPEEQFIDKLRQYGGVPEQVLAERELMELMLPILRADFQILETYIYKEGLPMECPITAFGGIQDPKIKPRMIEAWRNETSCTFRSMFYPGGHFFISERPQAVVSAINNETRAILQAGG